MTGFFQASIEQIKISRDYNTLAWSDDFSWIRGQHSIQLGTDGIRTFQQDANLSRTNGSFTFNGNFSNVALTDFHARDGPSAFRQGSPAPDNVRGLHLSWYAQDDIKVNRRLTVNLGLRYELPLPPIAINDAAMAYRRGRAIHGVCERASGTCCSTAIRMMPRSGRNGCEILVRSSCRLVLCS